MQNLALRSRDLKCAIHEISESEQVKISLKDNMFFFI